MIRETIKELTESAIHTLVTRGELQENAKITAQALMVSRTKEQKYGDFATNAALLLAKTENKTPKDVAAIIASELSHNEYFNKVEIAGPGFINFTLSDEAIAGLVVRIAERGDDYGRSIYQHPKRALVEFVSANPTGGLHLGHARGAFVGDALSRLLRAAGFQVVTEYYVNDAGNQVHTLARTIHKRYRELFGETVTISPGEYPADYVKDIAQALKALHGDRWLHKNEDEWLLPLTQFGVEYNLSHIKRSLANADVHIDQWFHESDLHKSSSLVEMLDEYQARNMLYEAEQAHGGDEKIRREESKAFKFAHLQEGGIFLKTTLFGDTEDRIVRRRDGRFVYLTADLAYHHQKFRRQFDLIVDVFGGDHAGHIDRIKAGMAALGHDVNRMHFVVVQMMRLLKNGQEVKFSKRSGEVVGLDDLLQEVGKDVARFVFLMRSSSTQFDLDLDLVTRQSNDNPVFYVQYGHARMATILRRAQTEHGLLVHAKDFSTAMQQALTLPEERDLILKASELTDVVREAADALEPHRLIYFCQELIKLFHSYFTKYRHSEKIISDDRVKTMARLSLVSVLKQTIFNALNFIGVSAPERMELHVVSDEH